MAIRSETNGFHLGLLLSLLNLLRNRVQWGFLLESRILIRSDVLRTCLLRCPSEAVCSFERLYAFIDRGCFYWRQSMLFTSLLLWWLWWLLSQHQWSLRGLDKIHMLPYIANVRVNQVPRSSVFNAWQVLLCSFLKTKITRTRLPYQSLTHATWDSVVRQLFKSSSGRFNHSAAEFWIDFLKSQSQCWEC